MFLTSDNKIKWRKIGIAGIITGVLVFAGICCFDKPLFMMLRYLNCPLWEFFDKIFAGEVWIIVSFIAALFFCAKKCAQTDCEFLNPMRATNVMGFIKKFFYSTKNNYAFLIFYSVFAAGIIAKIAKTFIGRARPIFFEALDMTGFFPPSTDWAFNSMPSGHTTISFAGLVMIGLLAPKYKALTWGMAIIIAVSRVAIGAHWPSDVILGAFIGMVVADVVKGILAQKK